MPRRQAEPQCLADAVVRRRRRRPPGRRQAQHKHRLSRRRKHLQPFQKTAGQMFHPVAQGRAYPAHRRRDHALQPRPPPVADHQHQGQSAAGQQRQPAGDQQLGPVGAHQQHVDTQQANQRQHVQHALDGDRAEAAGTAAALVVAQHADAHQVPEAERQDVVGQQADADAAEAGVQPHLLLRRQQGPPAPRPQRQGAQNERGGSQQFRPAALADQLPAVRQVHTAEGQQRQCDAQRHRHRQGHADADTRAARARRAGGSVRSGQVGRAIGPGMVSVCTGKSPRGCPAGWLSVPAPGRDTLRHNIAHAPPKNPTAVPSVCQS